MSAGRGAPQDRRRLAQRPRGVGSPEDPPLPNSPGPRRKSERGAGSASSLPGGSPRSPTDWKFLSVRVPGERSAGALEDGAGETSRGPGVPPPYPGRTGLLWVRLVPGIRCVLPPPPPPTSAHGAKGRPSPGPNPCALGNIWVHRVASLSAWGSPSVPVCPYLSLPVRVS